MAKIKTYNVRTLAGCLTIIPNNYDFEKSCRYTTLFLLPPWFQPQVSQILGCHRITITLGATTCLRLWLCLYVFLLEFFCCYVMHCSVVGWEIFEHSGQQGLWNFQDKIIVIKILYNLCKKICFFVWFRILHCNKIYKIRWIS